MRSTTAGSLHNPFTAVDRFNDADDIVRHAFRARLIDGSEPFVRGFTLDGPVTPSDLLPDDVTIERCVTSDSHLTALASHGSGSILVRTFPHQTIVSISAPTDAAAHTLEQALRSRVAPRERDDTVVLRTWHMGCNEQPRSDDRSVDAPLWEDIARNYPIGVRAPMQSLMELERPEGNGKLLLWHGEPGTGKTTALRALLRAWRPWCASQYIADPETLFSHPGYIAEVITRPPVASAIPRLDRVADPETQWRLIIAEDSDEFLRASARRDSGASLGRVLNLADGLLGQGHNALILLTTNEELHSLHPALTRPGRCLARIEFTRFSRGEATAWLQPGSLPPTRAMTLAELIEHRGELRRIGDSNDRISEVGQYL